MNEIVILEFLIEFNTFFYRFFCYLYYFATKREKFPTGWKFKL